MTNTNTDTTPAPAATPVTASTLPPLEMIREANANANANAKKEKSAAQKRMAEKQAKLRAALSKLSAEAGVKRPTAASPERVAERVEVLKTGTIQKKGKAHTLTLSESAKEILALLKATGNPELVPNEVRARFPWSSVSAESLEAAAIAADVAPELFARALTPVPVTVAMSTPAPDARGRRR